MIGEQRSLTGEETIRVAIADDQSLFASGISRILAAQTGVDVVAEASTGQEAVEACQEEEPDVILMDISMPVMDGIAATRKIRDLLPGIGILILTVHADDHNVFQGIKAGAQGYLLKDCTTDDLTRAIRSVHAGDTIMSPGIARNMLSTFEKHSGSETDLAPHLTERELEVIRSLARGMSNKQIAQDLSISEKTVRNHASNIYKKLHIFDRTQAVLYAVREGLVDPESLDFP